MKRIAAIVLLLFSLAVGVCSAEEQWVSVGNDVDGYEWLYDANTLLNDGTGHFTVTFAKMHPDKKTWYKGDLSILPMRRLYSLNRWEEHKKEKSKFVYWTYDYKLKSYGSSTMYNSIGESIVRMTK